MFGGILGRPAAEIQAKRFFTLPIISIRYAAPRVIIRTAPFCELKASEANPINGGKIVPPKMPIIIRPEISFFLSGRCKMAVGVCKSDDSQQNVEH